MPYTNNKAFYVCLVLILSILKPCFLEFFVFIYTISGINSPWSYKLRKLEIIFKKQGSIPYTLRSFRTKYFLIIDFEVQFIVTIIGQWINGVRSPPFSQHTTFEHLVT